MDSCNLPSHIPIPSGGKTAFSIPLTSSIKEFQNNNKANNVNVSDVHTSDREPTTSYGDNQEQSGHHEGDFHFVANPVLKDEHSYKMVVFDRIIDSYQRMHNLHPDTQLDAYLENMFWKQADAIYHREMNNLEKFFEFIDNKDIQFTEREASIFHAIILATKCDPKIVNIQRNCMTKALTQSEKAVLHNAVVLHLSLYLSFI